MSDEQLGTHYLDAAYYDHAYARYKGDLAFYREVALGADAVLELGIGTGRVAMALADDDVEVVGVDRSPAMLARCEARLSKKPARIRRRITYVEGDIRTLRLERRFTAVIAPFNVLQHLHRREDLEDALRTVDAHLADGGRFAFDVLTPDPASLSRDPDRWYKCRALTHPEDGRRYDYAESFQYDHDTQVQTTTMRFTPQDGGAPTYHHLPQRQYFPRELEALLFYNGFVPIRHDGGFERETLDAYSESQVVVARRR